jgi:hypothetical protein
LTCETRLAEEVAGAEHGDHGLLALLGYDCELDAAPFDVEDRQGGVSLPKDALARLEGRAGPAAID